MKIRKAAVSAITLTDKSAGEDTGCAGQSYVSAITTVQCQVASSQHIGQARMGASIWNGHSSDDSVSLEAHIADQVASLLFTTPHIGQ